MLSLVRDLENIHLSCFIYFGENSEIFAELIELELHSLDNNDNKIKRSPKK